MVEILQVGIQASKEPGVSAGDQENIKPLLTQTDIFFINQINVVPIN